MDFATMESLERRMHDLAKAGRRGAKNKLPGDVEHRDRLGRRYWAPPKEGPVAAQQGGTIDFRQHNPMELFGRGEQHLRDFMHGLSKKDKRAYLKAYNLAPSDDIREADEAGLVTLAVSAARDKHDRMHRLRDHAPKESSTTEPGDGLPPTTPFSARPTTHPAHRHLAQAEEALRATGHHEHADAVAKVRGAIGS